MERKFGLFFWGLAALGLFWFAGFLVIKGGFVNYFQAVALLFPFILMLFLRFRSCWHMIILLSIVAGRLRLSSYGLQNLTPMLVTSLLLIGVMILDRAMHRFGKEKFFGGRADKAALIIAVFMTARMLIDRPGFVGMGAAEGGFFKALDFVVGAWIYFAVQRMAAVATFTRRQLKISTGIVVFLFILALIRTQLYSGHLFTRAMGEQESWMLVAMLLALISTSPVLATRTVRFYATSFAFLFMAAISTYRARALYILFEILAIARFTKTFRRTLIILGVGGALGLSLLLAFPRFMPSGMERFVSLITDVDKQGPQVGAYGWQDSFRGELYRIAWSHITRNPVLGRGYGLNVEEALSILAAGDRSNVAIEMVAIGGNYHNSIVSLAVVAGLPIAILFTFIVISVPVKFSRMLHRLPDGDFRTWGFVFIAFYFGVLGMMLLNGGGREVFYMMIVTGYMMGMMRNPAAVLQKTESAGQRVAVSRQGSPFQRPGTSNSACN